MTADQVDTGYWDESQPMPWVKPAAPTATPATEPERAFPACARCGGPVYSSQHIVVDVMDFDTHTYQSPA